MKKTAHPVLKAIEHIVNRQRTASGLILDPAYANRLAMVGDQATCY
ncbi:MAG: hypothetical protein OFPII_33640 [Osedax symbiont Rs1]|nr:MAG: hypothetical protein OFPII_33640 [Osedax symbiont Rs1]